MFKGFTIFLFVFTILLQQSVLAQKKELTATRINTPPKIDGVLDDAVWDELKVYGDFNMFEPGNEGLISKEYQTLVKMAYDDNAVYIAVCMFDPNPDKILRQLSQRDEVFVQADLFYVALNIKGHSK